MFADRHGRGLAKSAAAARKQSKLFRQRLRAVDRLKSTFVYASLCGNMADTGAIPHIPLGLICKPSHTGIGETPQKDWAGIREDFCRKRTDGSALLWIDVSHTLISVF